MSQSGLAASKQFADCWSLDPLHHNEAVAEQVRVDNRYTQFHEALEASRGLAQRLVLILSRLAVAAGILNQNDMRDPRTACAIDHRLLSYGERPFYPTSPAVRGRRRRQMLRQQPLYLVRKRKLCAIAASIFT